MTKRGRPPRVEDNGIHKVRYYELSKVTAANSYNKIIHERLLAGYKKLFKIVHEVEANQQDMITINKAIRDAGF